jgi:hypothetical protein
MIIHFIELRDYKEQRMYGGAGAEERDNRHFELFRVRRFDKIKRNEQDDNARRKEFNEGYDFKSGNGPAVPEIEQYLAHKVGEKISGDRNKQHSEQIFTVFRQFKIAELRKRDDARAYAGGRQKPRQP